MMHSQFEGIAVYTALMRRWKGGKKGRAYLKLPSCSKILCLLKLSRSKVVPLGSGLVVIASPKRNFPSSALMLRAVESAEIVRFSVMNLPSWGRKP